MSTPENTLTSTTGPELVHQMLRTSPFVSHLGLRLLERSL